MEDVTLMAKFMGVDLSPCSVCSNNNYRCDVVTCRLCDEKNLIPPDYPNDMNALLGVMQKLLMEEVFITDISGEYGTIKIWDRKDEFSKTLAEDSFQYYSEVPRVLFPLLVEAIRQIEEVEG